MTKDEALKMAIKEMTDAIPHLDVHFDDYFEAINACKEKLEQPAQEPLAYIKQGMDGYPKLVFNGKFEYASIAAKWDDIALYTKEQL